VTVRKLGFMPLIPVLAALSCAVRGGDNATEFPDLPEPVTNNAVAVLPMEDGQALFSFMGLGPGKEQRDVHSKAWMLTLGAGAWETLPDVPGASGRLGSVAVGLYDRVFIFGGYTVAEGGGEVSTSEVYAFDPVNRTYQRRADIPVPVDDSWAFAYADRYIYLVSGWHDDGNVGDVQVLDTWEDRWFSATSFPGTPVFGHAGGIVGDRFVISDGVKVDVGPGGRRQFVMSDESWLGTIDATDPATIDWRRLPNHPGPIAYRMAATGSERLGRIIFTGGSTNPYNYSGIGYDGRPSEPSRSLFAFDAVSLAWTLMPPKPTASMDHRGLLETDRGFVIVGGMTGDQAVSSAVEEALVLRARP
jgi:hypothetical protein